MPLRDIFPSSGARCFEGWFCGGFFALEQTLRQNGTMEPHPHNHPASIELPAEQIPAKLPLVTRVIAGVLILAGTLALVDGVLQWLFGRGVLLNGGAAMLLLGWGLMRRREWARVFSCVLCSFFTLAAAALVLASVFASIDNLHISPDPGDIGGLGRRMLFGGGSLTLLAGNALALKHLMSDRIKAYYQCSLPRDPMFVWNPRNWRFSIGTLLFLTLLVSIAAVQVARDPMFRQWRLIRQTQPQSMPAYLQHLPPMPSGEGSVSIGGSTDERIYGLRYGYVTPPIGGGVPHLQYAYFVSKLKDGTSLSFPSLSQSDREGEGYRYSLEVEGHPTQIFPGDVQLVEVYDGKLRKSKLLISFPEFWSFLHSDEEYSLNALEQHVQKLRYGENASE